VWHVSLTRTCVGAIQEHTVLTCFKHFSCDMKLHTAKKEKERDLVWATELWCQGYAGTAALAKRKLAILFQQ